MNNLIEALKEPARLMLLAFYSWLLTEGVRLAVVAFGSRLDPSIQLFMISGLLATLKGVDKYIHDLGKDSQNDNLIKGLTRF